MDRYRLKEEIDLQDVKRVSLADKVYVTKRYIQKQVDAFGDFKKLSTSALMHYSQLKSISETLEEVWEDFLYLDNMRTNLIDKLSAYVDDGGEIKCCEEDWSEHEKSSHIPNEETLEAMRDVENGVNLTTCDDIEDMFRKLELEEE